MVMIIGDGFLLRFPMFSTLLEHHYAITWYICSDLLKIIMLLSKSSYWVPSGNQTLQWEIPYFNGGFWLGKSSNFMVACPLPRFITGGYMTSLTISQYYPILAHLKPYWTTLNTHKWPTVWPVTKWPFRTCFFGGGPVGCLKQFFSIWWRHGTTSSAEPLIFAGTRYSQNVPWTHRKTIG